MPDSASLYDKDWYAWTQEQAARLRELPAAGRPNGLDVENLAEEVESMGASQRRAIRSLLEQLYIHLLKLAFHPAAEAVPHWQTEVDGFRIDIEGELEDSPSLRPRLPELAASAWARAESHVRRRVGAEAPELLEGMAAAGIDPAQAPYDLASEVLNRRWYPARAG